MCGRFTLRTPADEIAREFQLVTVPTIVPRYNIAPSQPLLAIRRHDAGRQPALLRWGLIPRWANDPKIAYQLINARSETVAEKPAFRDAFKKRRCLIPADGFYEWKKLGKAKQPYHIHRQDGRLFAFAGLWERWQAPGSEPIESCTILTTVANTLVADVHDRMPVMLLPEQYDAWLDPARSVEQLRELVGPYPAELLAKQPVSPRVNNPKVDDPGCLDA
jgi:putative SOS response-associated peptidase YedK